MAADGGSIFTAGQTTGALIGQTSAGSYDVFLRKRDAAGNELWSRQFGTDSDDRCTGVVVTATDVYVLGQTSGELPGQTNSGYADAFLSKYSAAGDLIWIRQFGSAADDYPRGIAVDSSGIYVTGFTSGIIAGLENFGGTDAFLRKYDFGGTDQWTRQFGTSDEDRPYTLGADDSGIYLAGGTMGSLVDGYTNPGSYDVFVRQYLASGGEGWTDQFGTSAEDRANAVAAGASGIYVTGYTTGSLVEYGHQGGADAFIRNYESSGSIGWTRQFGTSGDDTVYATEADTSGVFVAGSTTGLLGQTSSGGTDAFVRKYEAGGNPVPVWTTQFGTAADDAIAGISLDGAALYVAGHTTGVFAAYGQSSLGGQDAFVAKLIRSTAPTNISLSASTVAENEPAGTLVGTLSTADPDAGELHTYALVPGEGDDDNGSFVIPTDTNELRTAESFDFEAKSSYSIRVRSTDSGGLYKEEQRTIRVTNINESPIAIIGGLYDGVEGQPLTFDASLSRDPDGDPLRYRWDFDSDGTWEIELWATPTVTHIWPDDFNGSAIVEVFDGQLADTATTNVNVMNVSPAFDLGANTLVRQGQPFIREGLFADPGNDMWTASVDYGDGAGPELLALRPDRTFTLNHLYTTRGEYTRTVVVSITDNDSPPQWDTTVVTVDNQAPLIVSTTPSFAASGTLPEGTAALAISLSEHVLLPPDNTIVGELRSVGPDGLLGNADDAVHDVSVQAGLLFFPAVTESVYRLTVFPNYLSDTAGNLLDGNGDGVSGGNWVQDFVGEPAPIHTFTSPHGFTFDPEIGGWGSGQLVEGTSGALDGLGRLQIGGVDYSSAVHTAGFSVTEVTPSADFQSSAPNAWYTVPGLLATVTSDGINPVRLSSSLLQYNSSADLVFSESRFAVDGSPLAVKGGYDQLATGKWTPLQDEHYILLSAGTHTITVQVRASGILSCSAYNSYSFLRVAVPTGPTAAGPLLSVTEVTLSADCQSSTPNIWNNVPGLLATVTSDGINPVRLSSSLLQYNSSADFVFSESRFAVDGSPLAVKGGYDQLATGKWTPLQDEHYVLLSAGTHAITVQVRASGILSCSAYNSYSFLRVAVPTGPTAAGPLLSVTEVTLSADCQSSTPNIWNNVPGLLATVTSDGINPVRLSSSLLQYNSSADLVFSESRFAVDGSPLAVKGGYDQLATGKWTPLQDEHYVLLSAGTHTITVQVRASGILSCSAYNNYSFLRVAVPNSRPIPIVVDNAQTSISSPEHILGLIVNREITVPNIGSENFARTVDVFDNPTGSSITATVRIVGNLGSDAATAVFMTSDGDTDVEPTDEWIGTDDTDGSGTPAIIHYVHGPAGLHPTALNVIGDNIEWFYDLMVPAGETVRLSHFTILANTRSEAVAAANVLVTPNGFGGEAAAFLTADELNSLANFQFATTSLTLAAGNLVIEDTAAEGKNDALTLSVSDGNLIVEDPDNIIAAGVGMTQVTPHQVRLPLDAVPGGIQVNTRAGDDTLNLDFTGGNMIPAGRVTYVGGNGRDALNLIGGTFATATCNYFNVQDGHIVLDSDGPGGLDARTVSYIGLEPITNSSTVADVVFNLPSGGNTVFLEDDGMSGNGLSRLRSDLITFATTTFANPSNSLTINRGDAYDDLTIGTLPDCTASLTIGSPDDPFDQVDFAGAITLSSDRSVTVNASGTLSLSSSASDLTTSGTGSIHLTTARNITLAEGSSLYTTDGGIVLSANLQGTASGAFAGVDMIGADIRTAGAGSIAVVGRGGNQPDAVLQAGVSVRNGSRITSTASSPLAGSISLSGTGGGGVGSSDGVRIGWTDTVISSVDGNIAITGTGGGSSSSGTNMGVTIDEGCTVQSIGTGVGAAEIIIQGRGGAAEHGNEGIRLLGHVTTVDGGIELTGTGGDGTGFSNFGMTMAGEASTSGAGSITMRGFGGSGSSGNSGVIFFGNGTVASEGTGFIHIEGSEGSGDDSLGIVVQQSGYIASSAAASVVLIANSLNLQDDSAVNAGANVVEIRPRSAGNMINLGGADAAGTLGLTDAELDRITANVLRIGSASAGMIDVSADISPDGTDTLHLITGGAIQSSAGMVVPGLALEAGGDISLGWYTNDFDRLAVRSSELSIFDADGMIVDEVHGVAGVQCLGGASFLIGAGAMEIRDTSAAVDVAGYGVRFELFGDNALLSLQTGAKVDSGLSAILAADKMDLAGTVAVNGVLGIWPYSPGKSINLGSTDDAAAGSLELSDAELDGITASRLVIGSSSTGPLTISQTIAPANISTLHLISGGAVTQSAALQVTNLAVEANGARNSGAFGQRRGRVGDRPGNACSHR